MNNMQPLKFYSEKENHYGAECPNCKKVINVKKEYLREDRGDTLYLNIPVRCFCGATYDRITVQEYARVAEDSKIIVKNTGNTSNEIKCPKCNSTQVTGYKKGFGWGKSAVGGLALGPVGLLGGFVGSRKVVVACLKCGHKWEP